MELLTVLKYKLLRNQENRGGSLYYDEIFKMTDEHVEKYKNLNSELDLYISILRDNNVKTEDWYWENCKKYFQSNGYFLNIDNTTNIDPLLLTLRCEDYKNSKLGLDYTNFNEITYKQNGLIDIENSPKFIQKLKNQLKSKMATETPKKHEIDMINMDYINAFLNIPRLNPATTSKNNDIYKIDSTVNKKCVTIEHELVFKFVTGIYFGNLFERLKKLEDENYKCVNKKYEVFSINFSHNLDNEPYSDYVGNLVRSSQVYIRGINENADSDKFTKIERKFKIKQLLDQTEWGLVINQSREELVTNCIHEVLVSMFRFKDTTSKNRIVNHLKEVFPEINTAKLLEQSLMFLKSCTYKPSEVPTDTRESEKKLIPFFNKYIIHNRKINRFSFSPPPRPNSVNYNIDLSAVLTSKRNHDKVRYEIELELKDNSNITDFNSASIEVLDMIKLMWSYMQNVSVDMIDTVYSRKSNMLVNVPIQSQDPSIIYKSNKTIFENRINDTKVHQITNKPVVIPFTTNDFETLLNWKYYLSVKIDGIYVKLVINSNGIYLKYNDGSISCIKRFGYKEMEEFVGYQYFVFEAEVLHDTEKDKYTDDYYFMNTIRNPDNLKIEKQPSIVYIFDISYDPKNIHHSIFSHRYEKLQLLFNKYFNTNFSTYYLVIKKFYDFNSSNFFKLSNDLKSDFNDGLIFQPNTQFNTGKLFKWKLSKFSNTNDFRFPFILDTLNDKNENEELYNKISTAFTMDTETIKDFYKNVIFYDSDIDILQDFVSKFKNIKGVQMEKSKNYNNVNFSFKWVHSLINQFEKIRSQICCNNEFIQQNIEELKNFVISWSCLYNPKVINEEYCKLITKLQNGNKFFLKRDSSRYEPIKHSLSNFIVESTPSFDESENYTYIPLKIRWDKNNPNLYETAISNYGVFRDYDKNLNKKIFSGLGIVFTKRINNIIKRHILNACSGIIIDVGTGQGGDIGKWIENQNITKVYTFESNADAMKLAQQRLKDNYKYKPSENKIFFINKEFDLKHLTRLIVRHNLDMSQVSTVVYFFSVNTIFHSETSLKQFFKLVEYIIRSNPNIRIHMFYHDSIELIEMNKDGKYNDFIKLTDIEYGSNFGKTMTTTYINTYVENCKEYIFNTNVFKNEFQKFEKNNPNIILNDYTTSFKQFVNKLHSIPDFELDLLETIKFISFQSKHKRDLNPIYNISVIERVHFFDTYLENNNTMQFLICRNLIILSCIGSLKAKKILDVNLSIRGMKYEISTDYFKFLNVDLDSLDIEVKLSNFVNQITEDTFVFFNFKTDINPNIIDTLTKNSSRIRIFMLYFDYDKLRELTRCTLNYQDSSNRDYLSLKVENMEFSKNYNLNISELIPVLTKNNYSIITFSDFASMFYNYKVDPHVMDIISTIKFISIIPTKDSKTSNDIKNEITAVFKHLIANLSHISKKNLYSEEDMTYNTEETFEDDIMAKNENYPGNDNEVFDISDYEEEMETYEEGEEDELEEEIENQSQVFNDILDTIKTDTKIPTFFKLENYKDASARMNFNYNFLLSNHIISQNKKGYQILSKIESIPCEHDKIYKSNMYFFVIEFLARYKDNITKIWCNELIPSKYWKCVIHFTSFPSYIKFLCNGPKHASTIDGKKVVVVAEFNTNDIWNMLICNFYRYPTAKTEESYENQIQSKINYINRVFEMSINLQEFKQNHINELYFLVKNVPMIRVNFSNKNIPSYVFYISEYQELDTETIEMEEAMETEPSETETAMETDAATAEAPRDYVNINKFRFNIFKTFISIILKYWKPENLNIYVSNQSFNPVIIVDTKPYNVQQQQSSINTNVLSKILNVAYKLDFDANSTTNKLDNYKIWKYKVNSIDMENLQLVPHYIHIKKFKNFVFEGIETGFIMFLHLITYSNLSDVIYELIRYSRNPVNHHLTTIIKTLNSKSSLSTDTENYDITSFKQNLKDYNLSCFRTVWNEFALFLDIVVTVNNQRYTIYNNIKEFKKRSIINNRIVVLEKSKKDDLSIHENNFNKKLLLLTAIYLEHNNILYFKRLLNWYKLSFVREEEREEEREKRHIVLVEKPIIKEMIPYKQHTQLLFYKLAED